MEKDMKNALLAQLIRIIDTCLDDAENRETFFILTWCYPDVENKLMAYKSYSNTESQDLIKEMVKVMNERLAEDDAFNLPDNHTTH